MYVNLTTLKTSVVTPLVFMLLAMSVARASITIAPIYPSADCYPTSNFDSYFPSSDYSFASSPIPSGVDILGSISITGAECPSTSPIGLIGINILFETNGYGPLNAGDVLSANFNFSISFTGGEVFASDVGVDDVLGQDTFENFPNSPIVDGQALSGDLVTAPIAESGFLYNGFVEADIDLHWINYSPTDTLTLTIPENSFDITYGAVPEPAATSVLMLPTIALLSRPKKGS
jgi:hypothetical protein